MAKYIPLLLPFHMYSKAAREVKRFGTLRQLWTFKTDHVL